MKHPQVVAGYAAVLAVSAAVGGAAYALAPLAAVPAGLGLAAALASALLGSAFHAFRLRMRAEALRLREAAQLHEATAALGADCTFTATVDDAGEVRLDTVSGGLQALLGYTAEEVRARPWQSLLAASDLADSSARLARLLAGETVESEQRYLARDGRVVWLHVRVRPLSDGSGRVRRIVGAARDVTEQQRTRDALEQSEDRYRLLMSSASALLWVAGPDGAFHGPQKAWGDYTGQGAEQQRGFGWLEAVHPDDRERVRRLWQDAAAQPGRQHFDLRVWHAGSGTHRYLEARLMPVSGADGRLSEWVGKCVDIEDRRQGEEAQRRLAAIVESSQDAIISLTLDGTITSWNAGAERLFGWPATEVIGQSVERLLPADRRDEEQRILERIRRGQSLEPYETVRVSRGGRHIDISLSVSPVRDAGGTIVGAAKVARDISDRKAAEQRLRSLLELSEKLNSTLDVDALLDLLAQEAARLLGAAGGMAGLRRGDAMAVQRYFTREGATPLDQRWTAGSGLAGWVLDHRVPYLTNDAALDAQITPALREQLGVRSALATPLLGVDGQAIGFFELHNKRDGFSAGDGELLLAMSRTASIALQNALTHRRVLDTEEALRVSDRRKDEFLALLAHELRNPLAPVSNSLEILRTPQIDPATVRGVVEMMDRQVTHLVRLVDDLMEVSRITRGALQLKKEPVVLNTAVHGAVEISQPIIAVNAHHVELDLPDHPLLVSGDRTRLTQIIANLLNNAAKYTPPRGHIRVSLAREEQHAVLRVKDNGVGIPEEMLGQVFEMFTQVDRSLERRTGGLGIGLSLVRRLVEMHGGTVEAHSEGANRGSEFVVRVPLAVTLLRPALPQAPAAARPVASRRVLVVDDNRDAANSLALLLRTLRHEVALAHDGIEALERAEAFQPEVVLLDIGMPRMNGYDVARHLREKPWGRQAFIVALTGWGQEQDRRRSREAGFDRHLVKPVELSVLQELLAVSAEEPEQRAVS
ncbi:MAG TPA: PAS domain S-box protein [Candidatus Binatia bacterium]|nr:PAS domain S-box protein [Candidatus Binatia bacterium]